MKGSKAAIGAVVAVLLLTAVGAATWFYAQQDRAGKDSNDAVAVAAGGMEGLVVPDTLQPAPDYVFQDPQGAPTRFADFRGQVVVVNLWAEWCAPCKLEMPTLVTLSNAYAGRGVTVLPINVDADGEGVDKAREFLATVPPFTLYRDPKFQLPFEFEGRGGMPQTIVLDRQGRVRAHLTGGADWSAQPARAVIDALLAEPA